MKVLIREDAYGDLEQIYSWIAKDDPRAARTVGRHILEGATRLGRFPYIGHVGSVAGTYEWATPHLPYVLVYRVRTGLVSIEAIFHAAQERRKE